MGSPVSPVSMGVDAPVQPIPQIRRSHRRQALHATVRSYENSCTRHILCVLSRMYVTPSVVKSVRMQRSFAKYLRKTPLSGCCRFVPSWRLAAQTGCGSHRRSGTDAVFVSSSHSRFGTPPISRMAWCILQQRRECVSSTERYRYAIE